MADLRLVERGPSIPGDLIQASEDGRLVVFAGAGVSRNPPTKLPDFPGLVAALARELTPWTEDEINVRLAPHAPLDRVCASIQSHAGRQRFRKALHAKIELKGNYDPADFRAHLALLRLASTPGDWRPRLVTTNYDVGFEWAAAALGEGIPTHVAPALPTVRQDERGTAWPGIVHLHGKWSPNPQSAEDFVITEEDFGVAYLTEGWGARFLNGLFSAGYTVLFIGYRIEDPVLQYFFAALDPKHASAYALLPRGQPSDAIPASVIPVPYAEDDGHEILWHSIEAWADRHEDWFLADRTFLRQQADVGIPHDEVADSRARHILAREEGMRMFANLDPAPGLEWLDWIVEAFGSQRKRGSQEDVGRSASSEGVLAGDIYRLFGWEHSPLSGWGWALADWLTRSCQDPRSWNKLCFLLATREGGLHPDVRASAFSRFEQCSRTGVPLALKSEYCALWFLLSPDLEGFREGGWKHRDLAHGLRHLNGLAPKRFLYELRARVAPRIRISEQREHYRRLGTYGLGNGLDSEDPQHWLELGFYWAGPASPPEVVEWAKGYLQDGEVSREVIRICEEWIAVTDSVLGAERAESRELVLRCRWDSAWSWSAGDYPPWVSTLVLLREALNRVDARTLCGIADRCLKHATPVQLRLAICVLCHRIADIQDDWLSGFVGRFGDGLFWEVGMGEDQEHLIATLVKRGGAPRRALEDVLLAGAGSLPTGPYEAVPDKRLLRAVHWYCESAGGAALSHLLVIRAQLRSSREYQNAGQSRQPDLTRAFDGDLEAVRENLAQLDQHTWFDLGAFVRERPEPAVKFLEMSVGDGGEWEAFTPDIFYSLIGAELMGGLRVRLLSVLGSAAERLPIEDRAVDALVSVATMLRESGIMVNGELAERLVERAAQLPPTEHSDTSDCLFAAINHPLGKVLDLVLGSLALHWAREDGAHPDEAQFRRAVEASLGSESLGATVVPCILGRFMPTILAAQWKALYERAVGALAEQDERGLSNPWPWQGLALASTGLDRGTLESLGDALRESFARPDLFGPYYDEWIAFLARLALLREPLKNLRVADLLPDLGASARAELADCLARLVRSLPDAGVRANVWRERLSPVVGRSWPTGETGHEEALALLQLAANSGDAAEDALTMIAERELITGGCMPFEVTRILRELRKETGKGGRGNLQLGAAAAVAFARHVLCCLGDEGRYFTKLDRDCLEDLVGLIEKGGEVRVAADLRRLLE